MIKKILVLLSLFVVLAGMSSVCALDFSDLFMSNSGDNVTVDGIDFNVPKGFSEIENSSYDNETDDNPYVDYNMSVKVFTNASGDLIELSVSESADVNVTDSMARDASVDGNKTTINGVDGYVFEGTGFSGFSYAKDGKLVIVSAPNKELLNNIIIA